MSPARFITLVTTCSALVANVLLNAPVGAQTPQIPASSPAPAGAPSKVDPPSDSCGGDARLLATLNRPTVGYSPCAIPSGSLVLEEGYQNQTQGGANASAAVSAPVGFERIGLADRFELDVIGPNENRLRAGSTLATGASDLGLGFKAQLPQRGRFTYGIDGLVTAATGTGGFSAGGPTETVNFDAAYAASPAIGFGATLATSSSAGFRTLPDGTNHGERFGYLLPSVVVTAQIPNFYQFYLEIVEQTKLGPDQGGRAFTDFGVQKLVGRNVEFDVEYAQAFTPVGGARFHYFGFGTGLRLR